MKKVAYTAALAFAGIVSVTAPAMANMPQYNGQMPPRACAVDTDGERHCWNRYHRWGAERTMVVQEGQDVNSNTWADGGVRATLPPHNSRGTSRPDVGNDVDLAMTWPWNNW